LSVAEDTAVSIVEDTAAEYMDGISRSKGTYEFNGGYPEDDCQGILTISEARDLLPNGNELSDDEVRDIIESFVTIADSLMTVHSKGSDKERYEDEKDKGGEEES